MGDGLKTMDITESLFEHLKRFSSSPFLFIGSGLSRRYLGLETWNDLLKHFAVELPYKYEYYFSKANGSLPEVASAMALAFHDLWWASDTYAGSREIASAKMKKIDSPLKFEISRYIANKTEVQDVAMQNELALLRSAVIDGIITTNWDLLLEKVFPEYHVYTGQEELLFSTTYSVAEIYKIHGDCTKHDSLILTASDYSDYSMRNAYLASKLLTLFVEHPVIFIGYSLSDANIQSILESITQCLTESKYDQLKDRLIFVRRLSSKESSDSITSTAITLNGRPLPVTLIETDNFGKVYNALSRCARKFPAKILRKLKSHIYDIVLTNDKKNQIACLDIDKDHPDSKLEVVYGVGVISQVGNIGYEGIHIDHILKNIISIDGNYVYEQLILHTLPQLLRNSSNVPIYKYLRGVGFYDKPPKITNDKLPDKIRELLAKSKRTFEPGSVTKKMQKQIRDSKLGIFEIAEKYGIPKALQYVHYIDVSRVNYDDAMSFMAKKFDELWADEGLKTYIRKLVCMLDYMKYGPTV